MRRRGIGNAGFEGFYEREAQRVFATVLLLCRDRVVAEDAVQEAFARALERWDRLEGEPWAGGWVTTTAMNVVRRALRRRPSELRAEQPPIDAGVEMWDAVARLPGRQQEAVILYYRLATPVDEIARLMVCEPGTVRTHLSRARAALREALAEEAEGGP